MHVVDIVLIVLGLQLCSVHVCICESYSKNAIGVEKASKKRPFCSYRQ